MASSQNWMLNHSSAKKKKYCLLLSIIWSVCWCIHSCMCPSIHTGLDTYFPVYMHHQHSCILFLFKHSLKPNLSQAAFMDLILAKANVSLSRGWKILQSGKKIALKESGSLLKYPTWYKGVTPAAGWMEHCVSQGKIFIMMVGHIGLGQILDWVCI